MTLKHWVLVGIIALIVIITAIVLSLTLISTTSKQNSIDETAKVTETLGWRTIADFWYTIDKTVKVTETLDREDQDDNTAKIISAFMEKLAALNHNDKNVIQAGIELYKREFANVSYIVKEEGYDKLVEWLMESMTPIHCSTPGANPHLCSENPFTFLPNLWDGKYANEIQAKGWDGFIDEFKIKLKKEYSPIITVYMAEGDLYYEVDRETFSETIGDILPDSIRAYNAIRNNETIAPFLHDAYISLPFDQYAARLEPYLDFVKKYPNSYYAERIDNVYMGLVNILFTGVDNSPVCFEPDVYVEGGVYELTTARISAMEAVGKQDARFAKLAADIAAAFKAGKECKNNRFEGVDYQVLK